MSDFLSGLPFGATVALLERTISEGGMKIIARIDHAAAARAVGLEMPPTLVLLYGDPAKGTPIMIAAPAAALDLPLRVAVRESAPAGAVIISFRPVAAMLEKVGVSPGLAANLEPAQTLLIDSMGLKPCLVFGHLLSMEQETCR